VEHSRLDGILTLGGELAAGVEVKWRRFDWDNLVNYHKGEMQCRLTSSWLGRRLPMRLEFRRCCCICWMTVWWPRR
jgi:hypothetical protein